MNKLTRHGLNMHQRIAVAVSGGVDSLYSLITLKEQYQDVIAIHGVFLGQNNKLHNSLEPDACCVSDAADGIKVASWIDAVGGIKYADEIDVANGINAIEGIDTIDWQNKSAEINELKNHNIIRENHSLILNKHNKSLYADNEIITGLANVCEQFKIPLHIIDLSHFFFNAVIKPFVKSYAKGHTPNPCIDCNVNIKFGELWKYAQIFKADRIATGHYAYLYEHESYGTCLQQGHDNKKDQSYFLSLVPLKILQSAIFPLGKTLKVDAIDYLNRLGVQIPSPKESQDICFIPQELQQDYRPYIKEQAQKHNIELGKSGNINSYDGKKLGQHQGLWQYTEGQRRGLGISWHEPLYVCHKDTNNNNLILGNKNQCLIQKCITTQANILVQPELWPEQLFARIRYRQKNMPAKVEIIDNMLHIDFEQKQQLSAPDQIAAIYDRENVLLAAARIKVCL